MVKGFLAGVFLPSAAGGVAMLDTMQFYHLATTGHFLDKFSNATSTEQYIGIAAAVATAGLTGYALGKWKPKPWVNIPS